MGTGSSTGHCDKYLCGGWLEFLLHLRKESEQQAGSGPVVPLSREKGDEGAAERSLLDAQIQVMLIDLTADLGHSPDEATMTALKACVRGGVLRKETPLGLEAAVRQVVRAWELAQGTPQHVSLGVSSILRVLATQIAAGASIDAAELPATVRGVFDTLSIEGEEMRIESELRAQAGFELQHHAMVPLREHTRNLIRMGAEETIRAAAQRALREWFEELPRRLAEASAQHGLTLPTEERELSPIKTTAPPAAAQAVNHRSAGTAPQVGH